jgi:hypothetical protein
MPKLTIGSRTFATKKVALEHFRQILYAYDVGQRIDGDGAADLLELVKLHPHREIKVGCGIRHFTVRNAAFGTRCFWIIRTDGTETDFSFKAAIDGETPILSQVLEAMRNEVSEEILQLKHDYFRKHGDAAHKVPCAETGELVSIYEADADHAAPFTFNVLAITFLEARGLEPAADLIVPSIDTVCGPQLRDHELAEAWRRFHHRLARVRILSKAVHRARAYQDRAEEKDRQLRLADLPRLCR